MPGKYVLFISTNSIWGGSEVLWTQSAKQLLDKGYRVSAATRYEHSLIDKVIGEPGSRLFYINIKDRIKNLPLWKRALQKTEFFSFTPTDILHQELQNHKPDLVIISQGNNIEGLQFMKDCILFDIPFVTITHLVTPDFWPSLNDDLINELIGLYRKSAANYFVSKNTLLLHERLLGETFSNNEIVFNPFTKFIPPGIDFPPVENNLYKIALIGRIENFHKGYDLLIDVVKQDKWKNRPVHFSIFGRGPHVALLTRMLHQNNITNITLHDHEENIAEIWKRHHILLMPSRMEGQSLTLIEAMRFQRAAVVTNVGGTNELIEEGVNGFIAPYPIAEQIDEALERAWQKRTEWKQLGINAGKAIAEKHPADALSFFNEKIENVLRKK